MTAIEKVELPFLHLTFRHDLDIMFCRWRSFVNMQEFQEGYWMALEVAQKHHARFWLHDLRLRNSSTAAERHWFDQDFVSAVARQLPIGLSVAYLMSPLQHEHIDQKTSRIEEVISYGSLLQLRYFVSEHDALDWLQECRKRTISSS
ncbi:hypothetical protein [Pontibacter akesuensis]|uniref:SpoIIAA-like n=1 Tax=Pontibacter akesuensis TaxID=388950 RepID=A0A1I7ILR4_9BACT|nr:hypothetical protein [Pontibacter akesuensis]GHA67764.1 hypothetical protein GCM10007389_21330 [Pontibacter akesuensis]SFU73879.1 hypothetical protein SAMN04487941_2305 [Pontibacter akesuensis]